IRDFNFQNNLNAQLSPTTKVSLKLNTNLTYNDGPPIGVGDIYQGAINSNPVDYPKYYPSDSTATSGRDLNYGSKMGSDEAFGFGNPYAKATKGYSEQFSSTVLATMLGEQKLDFLTEGLTFKA